MAQKKKTASASQSAPAQTPSANAGGNTTLDVDALRQIVEILEASEVTRLVWRRGDERLFIRRDTATSQPQIFHAAPAAAPVAVSPAVTLAPAAPAPVAAAPVAAAAAAPAAPVEKPGQVITSPFVGTFYRSPAPDQPAFVDVGSVVKKGQTLCIVEAMKLMNEIESEVEGKVAEVLAENGQPVEFGQPLFRIEKA